MSEYIILMGILYRHNHFGNLVKAQAPLNDYGIALILFGFVEQQSGFAFFGAVTSVAASFNFKGFAYEKFG